MQQIKWIFFDVGSTLVDESACYEARFRETTAGTRVSCAAFRAKVLAFAAEHDDPYKAALQHFGLQKSKWHTALEQPFPFAERVLRALQPHYRLGVIANQAAGCKQRLTNWGLGKYFELIIASQEVGAAKPDPAIYEIALRRAGCLAQEAAMVGDRLDNDILPAQKCGMQTVWVRFGFAALRKDALLPDCIAHTSEELIAVFEK